MRPRGEVRLALAGAAMEFASIGRPAVTFRDLAERAQVGYDAARVTVRNMARAGELVAVECAAGPLRAYALKDAAAPARAAPAEVLELADVQCMWLDL